MLSASWVLVGVVVWGFVACGDARPGDDADRSADATDARDGDTGGDTLDGDTGAGNVGSGAAGDFGDRVAFLFAGADARQVGVDVEQLEAHRVAVVRGFVADPSGRPLDGVAVSVAEHPEHGHTTTGPDGSFDLVVNGGGRLVLRYDHPGYLPVARSVSTPWHDWVFADDVTLTALDEAVTEVALGADTTQVALATPRSDDDGARQMMLVFPPGLAASITLPDGGTRALDVMHVRASEYTVGARGPSAMPGALPAASAYTFAAELSCDEAIAAGASDVAFDRPVSFYVDDFLGIPVGEVVPLGFYDRARAAWIAEDNGRVVAIVDVVEGLAELDVDGDGLADDAAAALGIEDAERRALAAHRARGDVVWRVTTSHFSTPDLNWPYGLPDDAEAPPTPTPHAPEETSCESERGSIIGCESQSLGERIPIAGTPWSLVYSSARAASTPPPVLIPITGENPPASVTRVEAIATVAGQRFVRQLDASPSQRWEFRWNGRDAYGHRLDVANLHVEVRYYYPAVYRSGAFARAFGRFGANLGVVPTREELFVSAHADAAIGRTPPLAGLGGWSLDAVHRFDPVAERMTRADGSVSTRTLWGRSLLRYFTGEYLPGQPDRTVGSLAVAPDGTFYAHMSRTGRLAHFLRDGSRVNVTLRAEPDDLSEAAIDALAVDGDGDLYVAETYTRRDGVWGGRVRRRARDGTMTVVAGGRRGPSDSGDGDDGDGGPALDAPLGQVRSLALGPGGELYLGASYRVRRVDPDGVITTVLGDGREPASFDLPQDPSRMRALWPDVAVGPDGSVYVTDGYYLKRIDPSGKVDIIAGNGQADGARVPVAGSAPAREVTLVSSAVAVDRQGVVYVGGNSPSFEPGEGWSSGIARITPDGMISGYAGAMEGRVANIIRGEQELPAFGTFIDLFQPNTLGVRPDGALIASLSEPWTIADAYGHRDGGSISALDGDEHLHVFDAGGRHLRTVSTRTEGTLVSIAYDDDGRVTRLADAAGQVTTLTRDEAGVTITAPHGRATRLDIDEADRLIAVSGPDGARWSMGYDDDDPGLLSTLTDPRGATSHMRYLDGRLVSDADATGATQVLTRTGDVDREQIDYTSADGRAVRYIVERAAEALVRRREGALGLVTTSRVTQDARVITTTPDGVEVTTELGADRRFGMAGPVPAERRTRMPSGLTRIVRTQRTLTLGDDTDARALVASEDRVETNGRVAWTRYDGETRVTTHTTAAGRTRVLAIDAVGRPTRFEVPGLHAVALRYDDAGRLAAITQADRAYALSYDEHGALARITDPLARTMDITHDAAGRITATRGPDGHGLDVTRDAAGAIVALTTPGGSVNRIERDLRGDIAALVPPSVDGGDGATRFERDGERRVTGVTEADGARVELDYDSAGRLVARRDGDGTTLIDYQAGSTRVASIVGPSGVAIALEHDGALLVGERWRGLGSGEIEVAHTFDADLREVGWRVTSPAGGAVQSDTRYDGDGLVVGAGPLAITRDLLLGQPERVEVGAIALTVDYDDFGQRVRSDTASYGEVLARDAIGRITRREETRDGTTHVTTYGYDALGRLVEVVDDGVLAARYSWDAQGNRLARETPAGRVEAHFDARDRVVAVGDRGYVHDARGRRVAMSDVAGTTRYRYDAQDRLVGVTLPDGRVIDYRVDPLGRRVGRSVDGVARTFVYRDARHVVAELDATGAITSTFIYAVDGAAPDLVQRGETRYLLVKDHLGSVRAVVDTASGEVAQRIDYDAFGRVVSDTRPGFQPFGFAGGLHDSDSGLVHFGARDYDPDLGVWLTPDPLGLGGGANLYGYADQDPVNRIDPAGTLSLLVGAVVVVAVVVIVVAAVPLYDNAVRSYDDGLAAKRALECGDTAQDDALLREHGRATVQAAKDLAKLSQAVPGQPTNGFGPATTVIDLAVSAFNTLVTTVWTSD